MTDKVQKIREEVQRLQNELIQEKKKGFGSDTDDACILELQNVLTYIDSLQEEPVSVWHNMDEVPIKGEVIVVQTKDTFYGLSIQKGGTTYKNKNKDRYVRWAYASDLLKLSNVQRTVKNRKEPVSEELEEAVNAYIGYAPDIDECLSVYGKRQAFKAGAQWQKQQMINGAVETIIDSKPNDYGEFIPIIHVKVGSSYKDGEKVRIIIIKED